MQSNDIMYFILKPIQETCYKEHIVVSGVVQQDLVGEFYELLVVFINRTSLFQGIEVFHVGLILVVVKSLTN